MFYDVELQYILPKRTFFSARAELLQSYLATSWPSGSSHGKTLQGNATSFPQLFKIRCYHLLCSFSLLLFGKMVTRSSSPDVKSLLISAVQLFYLELLSLYYYYIIQSQTVQATWCTHTQPSSSETSLLAWTGTKDSDPLHLGLHGNKRWVLVYLSVCSCVCVTGFLSACQSLFSAPPRLVAPLRVEISSPEVPIRCARHGKTSERKIRQQSLISDAVDGTERDL